MPVEVGDLIDGKYRVERVLGEGGMGVVVAARHEHLGEQFALKILGENADPVREKRFLREARAAATLKSEHVARVFDVGKLPGGRPYMVMELLEGRDLDAVVTSEGAQPVALAVTYLLQAMSALAEAHALGMVHRDLKPGNLFLTRRRNGAPLVKLLDFGISKDGWGGSGRISTLTSTGAILGSPSFMAPEQLVSSRDVDARADIWSLGASLFELCTGELPFMGNALAEIYAAILRLPPRDMRALRPDLPAELARVVERCLEKDAEERYESVAELALALAPFAPGERALVDGIVRTIRGEPRSSAPPAALLETMGVPLVRRVEPLAKTMVAEPSLASTVHDPSLFDVVTAAQNDTSTPPVVASPAKRAPRWPFVVVALLLVAVFLVWLKQR
jgi:serine/threonine protein kinase